MEFIASRDELRRHYKAPGEGAVRKELRRLDAHCRAFIEKSPFVLIGSCDDRGNADVTPKGDRPGFVAMLDDTRLAIPDRPGNNRLDTWENIVVNPALGLLFLIPGMNETLRVNGRGRVTADDELRRSLAVDGRLPATVLLVTVEACYLHCAKAFMRSELWKPQTWPDRAGLPTLGQMLRDQLALPETAETVDGNLDAAYRKTMW